MVTKKKPDDREKIRVGTDLVKQLSTTFYPKVYMIFDELASNSRDAGATEVHLRLLKDRIEIEDNGDGMDRGELVRFFYISSTHKAAVTERYVRSVKRKIIGKFGIGKLSMYQICKKFYIETWKGGSASSATFDFSEFENSKFVDNFYLDVDTAKTGKKGSGTKIVLTGLKLDVESKIREIKRNLQINMPLTENFKIYISWEGLEEPVLLTTEDFIQSMVMQRYKINQKDDILGLIKGFIIYKNTEKGDYGVYVRVNGRVVRPPATDVSDEKGEEGRFLGGSYHVNFSSLSHARQFARKIYAEFEIDGLNDAIQTNRAGFVEDHEKYIAFKSWLKKTLNRLNDEQYEIWEKVRDDRYEKDIPAELMTELKNIGFETEITSRALDENEGEAILENRGKTIVINTSHPTYISAKLRGKEWGIKYHILKSSIILLAIKKAENLKDFMLLYDQMSRSINTLIGAKIKRRIKSTA